MVAPPLALIAARPADPSSRVPDSTTPTTRLSSAAAAEQKERRRRPVAVLAWAGREPDVSALDHEMVVGRRDEDDPLPKPLAVARRPARQRSRPAEDVREHARAPRRDVEHDADRRTQIGGQPLHDPRQNLDTPRRGAHHDQVAMAVELCVDSVPFHTNSGRSVGVPYQVSRLQTALIPSAMNLGGDGGLIRMKTDADSPKGADRDLQ